MRPFDLSQAEERIFKTLGYEVVERSEPIAKVKKLQRDSCEKTFQDWLAVARTYKPDVKPIKEIPDKLYDDFTLFGQAYIKPWYFDERSEKSSTTWSKEKVDQLWHSTSSKTYAYNGEGEAIYNAMKNYPLNGTMGMVIGSLSPWVEAYCLKCGAEKVITQEYKKIISKHPKIGYLHPIELAEKWKQYQGQFGFVASFSSIEHSGLGRYGDALDPIGDFRELQKVRCLLKDGGYAFIGIPSGADGIMFNAHRIYGRARLPLLFDGFKLLGAYYRNNDKPIQLTNEYYKVENQAQFVYALQKVDD